jgi:hypothetical protein
VTHGGIERAAKTSNSRLKKEKIRAAPPNKRCTATLTAMDTHGYRSKGVHAKCGQYTKAPKSLQQALDSRLWDDTVKSLLLGPLNVPPRVTFGGFRHSF